MERERDIRKEIKQKGKKRELDEWLDRRKV
jgi:hypothetical protein